MIRSDKVYVEDIRESIKFIFTYINDASEKDFLANFMLQDAVIRRLEIIGEASTISKEFKSLHSIVPWQLMKAMRNKLIHEYFGASAETIYSTIKFDLPPLLDALNLIEDGR